MSKKIRVTIWNEFKHEKEIPAVKAIYPEGMHKAIGDGISADDLEIRLASLDQEENGLPQEVVDSTDVMIWWGHCAHALVSDEVVKRVHKRILEGMGLIVLHSGHFSKIFRAVCGTTCSLKWREAAEKERLWTIDPSHPIAKDIPDTFVVPHTEMYGERFDIPPEAHIVFLSWYEGGNVFRSGVTLQRGHGKIFYFAPGHETFPIYYQKEILKVISNAVRWAAPDAIREITCPCVENLETIYTKPENDAKAGIVQSVD